jgi:putative ABC transport system permease protein
MKGLAILRIAFWALGRNKMRSALTMLGIIIGVSAVIGMVAIGEGAQAMVQDQMESMGTNIMYVWPGGIRGHGGARMGANQGGQLTSADVEAIMAEVPVVAGATPIVRAGGQLVFGNKNWSAQVQGTNEQFPEIREWPVAEGEFFTETDVRASARVIVIGATVAENLFDGANPIGQTVRVRNLQFRVTGVLSARGQSAMGQDQDDTVIMPYTAAQKKLLGQSVPRINQIMLRAVSPNATPVAEKMIADLLRQRHEIGPDMEDSFSIRNMSDVAETAEATGLVMTLLLASIAAVSLLVGGIGIMNIMLVSVTERTREIGIRMAVGSRPGYIRLQFLSEAVILSMAGGLFGVIVGGATAFGVGRFFEWPTLVSPASIVISFGFAAIVGVFFGYYPAHKAAALDPIDALRYE